MLRFSGVTEKKFSTERSINVAQNFKPNRHLIILATQNGIPFADLAVIAGVLLKDLLHAAGGWRRLTIAEEERVATVLGVERQAIFDQ